MQRHSCVSDLSIQRVSCYDLWLMTPQKKTLGAVEVFEIMRKEGGNGGTKNLRTQEIVWFHTYL